ncbi:MAG: ABC transporter ATP-binding protein [Chlamydiae bacterium]|nr:ABC transporter ATP-binding protein [Chlamydiota bacterium]MBI3277305.1 ABC transporter ATP-binding protein [Chlamydiota bacterium]
MSKPIIEVQNLSKLYHFGSLRPTTLKEVFQYEWSRRVKKRLEARGSPASPDSSVRQVEAGRLEVKAPPLRSLDRQNFSEGPSPETFWALKDVSFSLEPGEVVGIIGNNGAGKSTLLKILSQITLPTEGRAILRGRVGSLLEVGAGFHPDLTGRENIYLNGAILGMKKSEIQKRFDEIVSFSGIEKFIDTPVKHYSSGMYVRLGFSVAAHLDSEILFVDEVLAVGDVEFQKKCLDKIEELVGKGRTVLFVSHDMERVQRLCRRAILIKKGALSFDRSSEEALNQYLGGSEDLLKPNLSDHKISGVQLHIQILSENGEPVSEIPSGKGLRFVIEVRSERPIQKADLGIGINDVWGHRIVTFHTHYQSSLHSNIHESAVFKVFWPEVFLCPGLYGVAVGLHEDENMIAYWPNIALLKISTSDYFKTGKLPNPDHQGHVLARAVWEVSTA